MRNPKIVMTLMVRDEADVIAAMLEHHLAEGVDIVIVTDNGSVDGTREILADYAASGRVEVHDYLKHDKNQAAVVSSMAARAATHHGATWVVNADADEFFVAQDPHKTLRDALVGIPTGIGSFEVPVVNMTGPPAREGGALNRLVWRDHREESSLMETVALHSHPTSDVIHVGRADVIVVQGNHGVNIQSLGSPPPGCEVEVLHFPWRTFSQYATKIENTGKSYDANPLLNPSPRHHGMRDYRFLNAGVLEPMYLIRHPGEEPGPEFVHDSRVADRLTRLLENGLAQVPSRLEEALSPAWSEYSEADRVRAQEIARLVIPLEMEHLAASTRWRDMYRAEAAGRRRAEESARSAEAEGDRLARLPELRFRRLVGRAKRKISRVLSSLNRWR